MLINSIFLFLSNIVWVIYGKLVLGTNTRIVKGFARIICRGSLVKGKSFSSGKGLRIEIINRNSTLTIGNNFKVNDYFHLGVLGKVTIGDNVLVGSRVTIIDHEHGSYSETSAPEINIPPDNRSLSGCDVSIGDSVWIGEGAVILAGSIVGEGAIIGANSVVKGIVPSYTIVGGIPAKPIKTFNFDEQRWERNVG